MECRAWESHEAELKARGGPEPVLRAREIMGHQLTRGRKKLNENTEEKKAD